MHFPAFDEFYQRFLFLLPFVANFKPEIHFDYDAPETWQLTYKNCGGPQQSPIAISSRKVIPIDIPPLEFVLYDQSFVSQAVIRNNGHTADFKVPTTKFYGVKPYITGGLMLDCYEAEGVHFHWGSPTSKGSEHVLNGRRYDVEMHIVHRNNKYLTLDEAQLHSDGIAVLAVLFRVVRTPPIFYENGLHEVFSSLLHLGAYNSSYTLPENLTLDSLMSNLNRGQFYTYRGSLTTPLCSPVVLWHVFEDVLPISFNELPKFWLLRDSRNRPLVNNFRPLQPQENRAIFYRRPPPVHQFQTVQYRQQLLELPELIWL
ncbi:uncharacterized protein Dana_GF16571 [Drosophila ananassae]|uniref:Carbonic anhydrase n=1 Tax=Drosophila ananassae TaxID=7217 RepID=B3M219_DROAN|nr:carbonic anhydrase 15 [Drosophila ananassae]EDV43343.1 uncharacterized protein Dana_GF16571 [Drosophila ananassae]